MLPRVPRTNRHIEVPVATMQFRDGKLAHEHIYWDQASYSNKSDFLLINDCRFSDQKPPEKLSIQPFDSAF